MTLRQFVYDVFTLPAKALAGLSALLFGDFARNNEGKALPGSNENLSEEGLVGLVLDVLKYSSKLITNLLHNHKQAIAAAFWISLLTTTAAVLTLAFWPAALAAVTSFTLFGTSITAVVGTGFAAQLAAVGVLTTALTSAVVYTTAATVNLITAIKALVTGVPKPPVVVQVPAVPPVQVRQVPAPAAVVVTEPAPTIVVQDHAPVSSASKLSALSTATAPVAAVSVSPTPVEPMQTAQIFTLPTSPKEEQEPAAIANAKPAL